MSVFLINQFKKSTHPAKLRTVLAKSKIHDLVDELSLGPGGEAGHLPLLVYTVGRMLSVLKREVKA